MRLEVDGDVRDVAAVDAAVRHAEPEVVFHLAAQPLVRRSYEQPRETFEVNVLGTVNVLEAVRAAGGVRVVVGVTSDKCYENRGWEWGYRERDRLGGHDPYAASKAAAELVIAAYRRSFFSADGAARVASARAGNVIGGGDWGADRLVPDAARALLAGSVLQIRNPGAIRPWQHVLNPLSGYLILAQGLWSAPELAQAWNFGPPEEDARSVGWIVEQLRSRWPGQPAWEPVDGAQPHEAEQLKLDSSQARTRLGWRPPVPLQRGLDSTVAWYEAFARGESMRAFTLRQIEELTG
jgi:CDP-glucose 4,6-dehydratase